MPGPYRRVEAAVAYPEGENSHDKSISERSTPPYLSPEYPEASKSTSQSREVSVLYSGAQDHHQGSLLPEELEDQMPRLVAEESNRGSANINKEEVNKGPFVAVVGVAKGIRDSGAPIQLIPFNREELAEKRKAVESWSPVPYSSVASVTTPAAAAGEKGQGYEESGGRSTPKTKSQSELEELKRTTERLERVLAERNLFQQKVRAAPYHWGIRPHFGQRNRPLELWVSYSEALNRKKPLSPSVLCLRLNEPQWAPLPCLGMEKARKWSMDREITE